MRKILYVSGTRADYGIMKPTLKLLNDSPDINLEIVVTGMHLMKEFGYSFNEIKKDGFKTHKIKSTYKSDDYNSTIYFLSEFMKKLCAKINVLKPDILLVLGDRAEMLATAIVGTYLLIPVAHIHGGDVSSTFDDSIRHTITKLAHIHFPATKTSAKRIKQMGENNWRIQIVGAPGLDSILNEKLIPKDELFKKLNLNHEPTALLLQHSVSGEINSDYQIKQTMDALSKLNLQTVIIYPNSDPGGRKMIKEIESYHNLKFKKFKNLEHKLFLSLMNNVDFMIGNSSSAIIESASFKLPVINIGTRQFGRERSINVVDADYDEKSILCAIKNISSSSFQRKMKKCKNPYGSGISYFKIVDYLKNVEINQELIQKKINV